MWCEEGNACECLPMTPICGHTTDRQPDRQTGDYFLSLIHLLPHVHDF